MDMGKLYTEQSEIIKKQSNIIDDLFLQLLQYTTVDEEERTIGKIAEVARLRKEVEEI